MRHIAVAREIGRLGRTAGYADCDVESLVGGEVGLGISA